MFASYEFELKFILHSYETHFSSKSVGSILYFSKIRGFRGTHGTHANYAPAIPAIISQNITYKSWLVCTVGLNMHETLKKVIYASKHRNIWNDFTSFKF